MTVKIKKVLGFVMALVMVLSTGIGSSQALAAGNGEIKVTGTTEGKTYSIYKIFDLTLGGGDKDKVSYTIAHEWEEFFATGAGKTYIVDENTTEKLNPIVVDQKVMGINITESNVAAFAKDVMAVIGDKTKAATQEATGTTLTFSNLELGYYLVHPEGATRP